MTKLASLLEDFKKAIARLEDVLAVPKTEITRDSAIKRFEIAFDLAWKTSKAFIEERHSSTCASPQSCFKEAFRLGITEYDDLWIDLGKTRNETVHNYSEEFSERAYSKLPDALAAFKKLLSNLS